MNHCLNCCNVRITCGDLGYSVYYCREHQAEIADVNTGFTCANFAPKPALKALMEIFKGETNETKL